MKQHGDSGLAIAKFLEKHPAVEKVLHPGLPSHPQHEVNLDPQWTIWCFNDILVPKMLAIFPNYFLFQIQLAKKQCYGHSGMISFYIKGDGLNASKKFFNSVKVFMLAESLGGYESLCELPWVERFHYIIFYGILYYIAA